MDSLFFGLMQECEIWERWYLYELREVYTDIYGEIQVRRFYKVYDCYIDEIHYTKFSRKCLGVYYCKLAALLRAAAYKMIEETKSKEVEQLYLESDFPNFSGVKKWEK